MTRIDVSYMYVHLTWSLWFFIYAITSIYGFYIIWTDLKNVAGREDFVMALLISLWIVFAYGLWAATERFA